MFQVDQKVWDILHGEGTVLRADETYAYPVRVKFANGVECTYTLDGKYTAEHALPPSLYPYPVEIVKKLVKPSINWEHVRDEYKFLAQDANGEVWLYSEEPVISEDHWVVTRELCAYVQFYTSYTPGTCDWKDSLVARPKDA